MNAETFKRTNRGGVAVFFHYYELNETYRDNLIFFLSVAYRDDIDFYIIIAGECSLDLPTRPNIKCIYTENKNWDFGGYVVALEKLQNFNDYDYFIFINSSVRGPFLPNFFNSCWTELFTSLLKDDVHLVGASINVLPDSSQHYEKFKNLYNFTEPFSHVQTSTYALTNRGLKHLIDIGFYRCSDVLDKNELIMRYEIRLSQEIAANGWNIKCFLPEYNLTDYTLPNHSDINFSARVGDPQFFGAYFGRTPHPSELIFIKINRDVISVRQLNSHTYSTLLRTANSVLNWEEMQRLKKQAHDSLHRERSKKSRLKFKISKKLAQLADNIGGLR